MSKVSDEDEKKPKSKVSDKDEKNAKIICFDTILFDFVAIEKINLEWGKTIMNHYQY